MILLLVLLLGVGCALASAAALTILLEDDPIVLTAPGAISAESAAALREAIAHRRPNEPMVLSEGAIAYRLHRRPSR